MKKIWLLGGVVSTLLFAQEDAHIHESDHVSNAFALDVSLMLDASYNHISFDDKTQTAHLEIPGLVHGGEEHAGHSHTSLAGEEGLNFNYAELSIGAEVGEYFDVISVFHVTKEDFEVEEGYVKTHALPYGMQGKLGKFKSDFGYLNNKHLHSYDFYDMPLVYQALLGDHGLNEKGVQLQYIFPAPHYVMAGFEAFRGENEQSFGYESFINGVSDAAYPALFVGYLKTSLDVAGGMLQAGLSGAKGDARMDHLDDEEPHAFSGETTLYGADVSYRYALPKDQAITFRSEYLYRKMEGDQYGDGLVLLGDMLKKQAGFYSELIYRYDHHWQAGVRYSAMTRNDVALNGVKTPLPDSMAVSSAMIEYDIAEHNRIRLQYNRNAALFDETGRRNNKQEVIVQFTYMFGHDHAHEEGHGEH